MGTNSRSLCIFAVTATAAALMAALCNVAIYGAVLYRIATNAFGATGDFLAFYSAGYLVRTDRSDSLYDTLTLEWAERLLYPGTFEEPLGYLQPVFVAWCFAPLSLLPFTAAFFIFMGVLTLALIGILFTLRHYLADVPSLPRNVFLACAAFGMPTVASIVFGQVDLIALAGLLGAFLCLRNGQSRAAGLALCLVLVKPQLLIGVGLLLVVRRDWRAIGSMAVVGVPLLLLPALLTAPSALIDNAKIIASYPGADTALSVNPSTMPNWRGFIVSATNSENVTLWMPGFAVIAACSTAAAINCWRGAADLDRSYAVAALLPVFVAPHMHTQTLVVIVLTTALVLRSYFAQNRSREHELLAVSLLLSGYATAFFVALLAIQGLSLGVFPLMVLFGVTVAYWPQPPVSAQNDTSVQAHRRAA